MRRLALAGCLFAAACSHKPTEGGFLVTVHTDANAFVTCVDVSVVDHSQAVLGSTRVVIDTNHDDVQVGIAQDTLPPDVTLRVQGLYSASGCMAPALRNAAPASLDEHFSAGVQNIDVTVHRPGPGDDADSDGFTSAANGGPDCDDSNALANPAAAEKCTDVVDFNCNGKYGCDDPACANVACIDPPTTVGFASAPQSAVATQCSAAIVLELHDKDGNSVPAGETTTIRLAEMGTLGLNFFSDSGCTVQATSADLMKGQRQVRFYASGAKAGTTQLSASAMGLSASQQAFVVSPSAPVSIAFTSAPQSVKADACSGAVTLEVRDMQGNASPVLMDAPFTVTPAPAMGISLFSDATCTTALAMPKVASGTAQSKWYFKAARTPVTVTFTVDATPLTGATQDETIIPGDPTAVVFATNAQMVTAGACSMALTLKVQDAYGTDTTVPAATSLMLSGPPTFFTDSSCTTAANGVAALAANMGTATVYFRATLAGSALVTATGPGLPAVMQTEVIGPAAPSKIVFSSPTGGAPQSTCNGPDALETQDAFGNASPVTGAPLTINLAAAPASGFTFYPSGSCGSPITSVQVPVGASSASFNYFGTMAVTVTVTASSSLGNATQMLNLNVGPASKLVFVTTAQTVTANNCSAVVTLQLQDSGGNVVSAQTPIPVALNAAPGSGFTFYSDACTTSTAIVTVPMGSSQVQFHFKGTVAGAEQMLPNAGLAMATPPQTATINPAPPNTIVFTTPARSITAGGCSPALTLQARDPFGNPSNVAADTALTLSGVPPGGLTFFTDMACNTPPVGAVTMTGGTQTATFYARGNIGPLYTLTAQAATLGMVSQGLTVSPASASQLVILTSTQTRNTGACSGAVTVQREDAFNNPVTTGALAVALTQSPSGGLLFFSDPACNNPAASVNIQNGNPSVDVYFEGTVPGMPTLQAGSGALTPATQKENINVAPPTKLVFITPAQLAVPAGICSSQLTAQSQDAFGNPSSVLADTTVTFGAPPSMAAYYSDPACTNLITQTPLNAGTNTASWYFKGTLALTFTASATAAGIATSASQGEGIVAAGVSQLVYTTAARSQAAGACSQKLTVQRQDQYGNAVTVGGALALALSASPSTGITFYSDACVTASSTVSIQAGQSSVDFYFKGTVPQTPMVSATAGALAAIQTESVTNLAPTKIVFTTSAMSVQAGVCSAVMTVQARDSLNNPEGVLSATAVGLAGSAGNMTFFSDPGCTMGISGTTIPLGMTDASFYATGTTVSTPMVTATPAGLTAASQGFTITAAASSKLVYTTLAQNVGAAQCSAVVTVQVQDAYGNVSGVPSATTLSPAANPVSLVTFFQDAACATPLGAGVALAMNQSAGNFYMKGGPTIQSGAVTTSSSPLALTATPAQPESVIAGPPTRLVFTSAPPTLMAGECFATPVAMQLQDSSGNAATTGGSTVANLSASPVGGVSFFSDATCLTPAPTATIASGMSTTSFYVKAGSTGQTVGITAASGTLTSANQNVTVLNAVMSGTCTLANGTSSAACTISPALKDTTKTMMMFQASNNGTGANNAQVRCQLTSTSNIACSRAGGTAGDITVGWWTLARPTGLTVQHINDLAATASPQTVNITAVSNTNDTFLLFSTDNTATTFGAPAFTTAELQDTTHVTLTRASTPGSGLKHSLQVVEWTGATVVRGSSNLTNNNITVSATVADSTTTPTFLLDTWRWDATGQTDESCRQSVHGAITSSTQLTFTRAAGAGGNCNNAQVDVAYERISIPGHRVDVLTSSPAAAMDGTPITLVAGAVDLTRTLAFFSGQGEAGQASGECTDTTLDRLRDCWVRAGFVDANNVSITRPTVVGSTAGAFGLFVLQVTP
jgi:hypothetical protein